MRKFPALFVAALLAVSAAAAPARASVILSELCDPQTNYTTDRFIEIYNTGPAAVSLAGWSVVAIANSVDVTTWTLSGTLNAGQAMVCGNTTTVTSFTVNFPSASWSTNYTNWNGKVGDGAKLLNGATIIDMVLATGTLFENADLVRNAGVTTPTSTFNPAEWTATPVNLATDASPGSHNGSTPPPTGPFVTNVVTVPAVPTSADNVEIRANVAVNSGPITAVNCAWGTTAGSQPNVITMSLLSGTTYHTNTLIPAQPGGTTVYYKVQADDATASTVSGLQSYTLAVTGVPPTILAVGEMSDSTLLVQFSETVEETSAEVPAHYTIGALAGVAAVRDPARPAEVLVTIRNIPAGPCTLTVNGVADLSGDVAFGATRVFTYIVVSIPAGYYDSATGLYGDALRTALHNIIKNHTVRSYDYALTAFAITDIKPNGKIWDMYSDVPGGTPPYEYNVGDTGQGATEGLGYNREHSWPQSWFNGVSPPNSDLWILYPTDSKVNGYRGNYAYGKVGTPTITSLNGCRVGPSVTPGYNGTVFEPIDAYKGDLARSQFYVATRYDTEDGSWPGGPSADGANLYTWASDQYMQWSQNDPVSWKERLRNGAIYTIQHNRNPFVDHPEFVAAIYDPNYASGVDETPAVAALRLQPNLPNPFHVSTSIHFDIPVRESVSLRVFDVSGRLVRNLAEWGTLDAGPHEVQWDAHDDRGGTVPSGVYFYRLQAGSASVTRRLVYSR